MKLILFLAMAFIPLLGISQSSPMPTWFENHLGQLDSMIYYYPWDNSPYFREVYKYQTSTGLIESQVESTWDETESKWATVSLTSYNYKPNSSQLESQLTQSWNFNKQKWQNHSLVKYNENIANEELLKEDYYLWNDNTKSWDGEQSFSYTYYSDGRVKRKYFDIIERDGRVISHKKSMIEYIYNDLENSIEIKNYSFSELSHSYIYESSKIKTTLFNEENNIKEVSFKDNSKTTYIYDDNLRLKQSKSYSYSEENWTLDLTYDYEYDNVNSQIHIYDYIQLYGVEQYKITHYYSKPTATNISKNEIKQSVRLYPNPTSGLFNIKSDLQFKTIDIYSISGKLVKSVNGQGIEQIVDISDLPNGIYLLSIDGNIVSKVVRD
ncbi:MAG: T9SS type A sorting domain-containing protein [Carboxylicivirga sp.]|jgi:hypothetical protein|nr:T9SS type A sorting domain-containing protein [Carboxylicivirga sp.]